MLICPYCENPLTYEDVFGKNLHLDSFGKIKDGFQKSGDIYKCKNEQCDAFDEHFYTRVSDDELHEGYPR